MALTIRKRVCIASFITLVFTAIRVAASPSTDFAEAVRLDLDGKAQLAFSSYLRAANAGLPQAQFNVAVMLDSGRGTPRDIVQAALWYARAAAHGNQRAEYNLGQLYELGEGVPQNFQIANAWFAASGLAASSAHLTDHHQIYKSGDTINLVAPDLIAPAARSIIRPEMGGVVFIWVAKPQSVSVKYYVELRSVEASASEEIFTTVTKTSSVFALLPKGGGNYAWRVLIVSNEGGVYLPSEWLRFSVTDESASGQLGLNEK